MTTEELRAATDRREKLAKAATYQDEEWSRNYDRRFAVAEASVGGTAVAGCRSGPVADHIAANDPCAVLASVERDRLLADAAALIEVCRFVADTRGQWDRCAGWLARLAALEAP